MKRLLMLCVFTLVTVPLYAQDDSDIPELIPLEISALHITRADDDLLNLQIEGSAATCGDLITAEWYSDVHREFITTETVDTIPAGDLPTRLTYQRYITITLSTLPDDEDDAACDLDSLSTQVVTMELPRTITMPNVPNYEREPDEDWSVVLLVNDFAAWFYLANDGKDDEAETETQPARGQAIDTGETMLIRWQKVDSSIEGLYSIGADPGYLIPWIEGYHPDGCEAPTLVNIVRDASMRDSIDHYTFSVFRLLPPDSICTDEIQPFVVSAMGVLPQRDLILSFGGQSYRFSRSDGTLTPLEPEP